MTTILSNLARNRDLVDREAASFEIVESQALRRELKEQTTKRDRDRQDEFARQVFRWLDLSGQDREQDDFLESCQNTRAPGTCQWFVNHRKTLTWFDEQDPRMVLWMKGKPGSGKTTIASHVVQETPVSPRSITLRCLCTELLRRMASGATGMILRLFCAQILRTRRDLIGFVYEDYVCLNATASLKRTRELLRLLVESFETVFIVLDGLDEYADTDQTSIIKELAGLCKSSATTPDDTKTGEKTKLLVCSRETPAILRIMRTLPGKPLVVNLTEEKSQVSEDVATYAKMELQVLGDRFSNSVIEDVGASIIAKADGKSTTTRESK